jgi:hypothetical protein
MAPTPEKMKQEFDNVSKKIIQLDNQLKKIGSGKRIEVKYGVKKVSEEQERKMKELQTEKKELLKRKEKLMKELEKTSGKK